MTDPTPDPTEPDDDSYPASWLPRGRQLTEQLAALPEDDLLDTINAALRARR